MHFKTSNEKNKSLLSRKLLSKLDGALSVALIKDSTKYMLSNLDIKTENKERKQKIRSS